MGGKKCVRMKENIENVDKLFICAEEMTLILYIRFDGFNVSEFIHELPSVLLEIEKCTTD